ncbi:MAG: hypothetical protein ACI8TP_001851 [Acidimicrobiales bacterium]|jgi:hypothetical protein
MEKTITISRMAERPYGAIADLLEANPAAIMAAAAEQAVAAANEVVVHVEGKWAWFDLNEDVRAELGQLDRGAAMARLPISWGADKHKRLLPSLKGNLSVMSLSAKHSEISFTALYAPPLGLFGGVEDFLLGRRILEQVIGRFLDEVVAHLEDQLPDKRF